MRIKSHKKKRYHLRLIQPQNTQKIFPTDHRFALDNKTSPPAYTGCKKIIKFTANPQKPIILITFFSNILSNIFNFLFCFQLTNVTILVT